MFFKRPAGQKEKNMEVLIHILIMVWASVAVGMAMFVWLWGVFIIPVTLTSIASETKSSVVRVACGVSAFYGTLLWVIVPIEICERLFG